MRADTPTRRLTELGLARGGDAASQRGEGGGALVLGEEKYHCPRSHAPYRPPREDERKHEKTAAAGALHEGNRYDEAIAIVFSISVIVDARGEHVDIESCT